MVMEVDAPENFDQEGNGLREPGKYHCVVFGIEEDPTNRDGKLIDNAVFRASLAVLDGTTPGQRDKQFDLIFFGPKLTSKDHGEMARKKIWFFAYAIGCGEIVNGKMRLDFSQAASRQCCMEIEMQEREWKDEKGVIRKSFDPQLHYCNVYHVDDPRVKDWPKDMVALGLRPAGERKKPEDFHAKQQQKTQRPENGTAGVTAPKQTTPPAQPVAAGVNLDDL